MPNRPIFLLLIVLVAGWATSCKKPCPLTPKEGYVIVGDDKNCYYELAFTELEITSVEELSSKLSQIEQGTQIGKGVALKMMNQLATAEAQFQIWNEFGALQQTYGEKITVNWNGNAVVPAQNGMQLFYSDWTDWNKPPLGVNTSGGAKNGAMWLVAPNEIELFERDGQNSGNLGKGNPAFNINSREDLHSVPAEIEKVYNQTGNTLALKFNKAMPGGFGNGTDVDVLHALQGPLKGKFVWHNLNAQTQQFLASDSVNMTASAYHMMCINVGMQATTMAGNKFAYISNIVPGTMDTLASLNNQFFRVGKLHSTQLNWSKAVPSEIELAPSNTPWDIETIPQALYNTWTKDIHLTNGTKSDRPGVTRADNDFTNHLRVPVAPEAPYAKFAFVSDQDMQFAEYEPDINTLPPPEPKYLNITELNFGLKGNSGPKVEKSFIDALGSGNEDRLASRSYNNVQLNVQTDRSECIASDGKLILDFMWVRRARDAVGIQNGSNAGMVLSNYKLYLNDPGIANYFYEYHNGNPITFLNSYRIHPTDVDIITELPPGKEAFGVVGQVNMAPGKTANFMDYWGQAQKKKQTNFAPLLGRDNVKKR